MDFSETPYGQALRRERKDLWDMLMEKDLNLEYLKNLLTSRKDTVRVEVRQMIIDKLTPLDTIKNREAEMELITSQLKILESMK